MSNSWCILIFALFTSSQLASQSLDFNPNNFDKWISLRAGNGKKPVYWYCYGEVYSYPEGKMVAKVQGLDIATMLAPTKDSVLQLNRKLFLYLDKDTEKILDSVGGMAVTHIKYPYQVIEYVLKGNDLRTYITQGSGARLMRLSPTQTGHIKKIGRNTVFSFPAFMNFQTAKGKYEAYENFDFILNENALRTEQRYQLTWWRYGELPAFLGSGRSVMQLVCHRVDEFEDLPKQLRDYIETNAKAWKFPPRDMNEIKALQQN
jgi:hypothetical protein